ncbi:MAG: agmatine deiminase family protein [Acidobacteriales bacterium]|nr:agmatine deiminase family protein [Terriglobales bacterium]
MHSRTEISPPRFPAEWEPHESTWLAWPHNHEDWPGKFEPIPWVYAEIIRHLVKHERVDLIVKDAGEEQIVREVLERAHVACDNVRFHLWQTNRVWLRDSGCSFVQASSGGLGSVLWQFNAWAKYDDWQQDREIGLKMAEAAGAEKIQALAEGSRIVLEGGSIDLNGQGALLTTEECLLSDVQQRNPGMTRERYEQFFAEYLGVRSVVWLASGIAGDDTHGHVDDITRFVSADTVVTAVESDPADVNYEPLRENIRRLREASDQDGHALAIIELPMPAPVYFEGRRLPASYANFYIANGVVLVPVFNDPNDRFALDILADVFPDRDVVGIYSGDLIWGFGAMHCMTQQQPALASPA